MEQETITTMQGTHTGELIVIETMVEQKTKVELMGITTRTEDHLESGDHHGQTPIELVDQKAMPELNEKVM